MKTLQGYLVFSIENNCWIVKDSLNYGIFACNVLLYYVAMQPWLWGPGPMHMLPPGRQPDNPLHHCTHIIYCSMNISLFLWQSEPVLYSICMHEMCIGAFLGRAILIFTVYCFNISTTMSNQGHKTLRHCKDKTHSFHISMIISYLFWKSEFPHFNDSW